MSAVVKLKAVSTEALLKELASRGGPEAQLATAGLLQLRKGADYNRGEVTRQMYFPFGLMSYAQMLHIKTMRINSLVMNASGSNAAQNFESIRDTMLDLINYASFAAEFMDNEDKVTK